MSFGFFSGFYGIILPQLQFDPQPESTTQPKARGLLHTECDFAITLPYKSRLQDNASIIEDLQEENSRTLGNYSRRLQDYSRISWSTFQPRDASSTLDDFGLEYSGTPEDYSSRPSRILKTILLDYKVLRGLSYGPPWAYYLGGYQDRLLGGPLGLLSLCHTAPDGVRRKDYGGEVLR
jgi:hypothetical protein